MIFNGKTVTLLANNANIYTQLDVPGTIDHLIDELRNTYNRPLPAADLFMANVYEQLMPEVVDVKDLGSGVVGGVECDHLAFRTKEVDWEIWIAQGGLPYPCRYQITSKLMDGAPQYTVQTRDWKSGTAVDAADFEFENSTNAKKTDFKSLVETHDLPKQFHMGEGK